MGNMSIVTHGYVDLMIYLGSNFQTHSIHYVKAIGMNTMLHMDTVRSAKNVQNKTQVKDPKLSPQQLQHCWPLPG